MRRGIGRVLVLILLVSGTITLALLARDFFGTLGMIITGAIGVLVTASVLRL